MQIIVPDSITEPTGIVVPLSGKLNSCMIHNEDDDRAQFVLIFMSGNLSQDPDWVLFGDRAIEIQNTDTSMESGTKINSHEIRLVGNPIANVVIQIMYTTKTAPQNSNVTRLKESPDV